MKFDKKFVFTCLVIVLTLLNFYFLYYMTTVNFQGSILDVFSNTDMRNDWLIGNNLFNGKGYTIDINMPAYNRQPLMPILLGIFDTPVAGVGLVLLFFLLSLLLLYVISESIIPSILFLSLLTTSSILFSLNYEFLHLVLFICCVELARKEKVDWWLTAALSLMVLARVQIAFGLIVACFFLFHKTKKYLTLPIILVVLYLIIMLTQSSYPSRMFMPNEATFIGDINNLQHYPPITTQEKIINYFFALANYLFYGAPNTFMFLFILVAYTQIKKFDNFIWLTYIISSLMFSLICFAPRYVVPLWYLLVYVKDENFK